MLAPMIGTASRNSARGIEPSRSRGSNARRAGFLGSDIVLDSVSLRSMNLRILSVNIGRARPIGTFENETVISGIDKRGVASERVIVRRLGIEGDEQADLRVHGGLDKAVYAYPSEHWPWWENEQHIECRPAAFGENLTLAGADESEVAIGDRFRWGAALLEVSQPRAPCYKLGLHTKRADAPQIMTLSARCGWYMRVLEEGDAP